MKLQVFIIGHCNYTKVPYPMVPIEISVSSEQEAEERAAIIAEKGIRVKSDEVHFFDKKKSVFVVYPPHRISEVRFSKEADSGTENQRQV